MNFFRKQYIMFILYGFLLIGIFPALGFGQDGTLDFKFGIGGKVLTQTSPGGYESGYAVAVQPDGKIIVAGESYRSGPPSDLDDDIALVRYNSNGSLDNTFGADGIVITPIGSGIDLCGGIALQPDGKIVAVGNGWDGSAYRFAALRYNSNGSLDNSFGTGGIATTRVGVHGFGWSCALQPDGKIIVVGPSNNGSNLDFGVVRFNSNGTLDNSFGTGGKVTTAVGTGDDFGWSCAYQTDGKIVVAGSYVNNRSMRDFAVVRYNSNGSLDNSFGIGGKVTTPVGLSDDRGRSMALQRDGKIVVAGSSFVGSNNNFAVVRYNPDGSLDDSFGSIGKVTTRVGNDVSTGEDGGNSIAIQTDGKILIAGWALNPVSGYDFAAVRYTAKGDLDSTFGAGGIVLTPIGMNDFGQAIALQADGRIVVAGSSYDATGDYAFAVIRYLNRLPTGITSLVEAPQQFTLFQNYPNPFNSSTSIRYTINRAGYVTLKVYDLLGGEITTLVCENQTMGEYAIFWNPVGLPSGAYFYRLQVTDALSSLAMGFVATKKLLLLK
jgi:uncharacterized delta-60 repeat protein